MTYKDITILEFQKVNSALNHHTEIIDGNAIVNRYEVGIEILNIFEDVPRSESSELEVSEFDNRLIKYNFLNYDVPSDEWVKEFKLNNKTYKVNQTPDKWNVGQFVSIASLTKDPDKIIDNIHLIVAVMCNKKEDDVHDCAREFQSKLSIEVAYPLALFFCAVMLKLPESMILYLKQRNSQLGLV